MLNAMLPYALGDTIAAISTPRGTSPVGIVRLSGPDAIVRAREIFEQAPSLPDKPPWHEQPGYRAWPGMIRLSPLAMVPATLFLLRQPASYTREDMVEFHLPGSPLLLRRLLQRLLDAGARLARPGEFTQRAFLNGRLDLAAAEGILGTIEAGSRQALQEARWLAGGELAKRLAEPVRRLEELCVQTELACDFSEDVPPRPPEFFGRELEYLVAALDQLLRNSRLLSSGESLPRVLLWGRANGGKSTLFRRLTGKPALVSPTPGTTRDVREAPWQARNLSVLLLDAPGTLARPDGLEKQALRRARHSRLRVDLVLLVADARRPLSPAERKLLRNPSQPVHLALNKIDLLPASRLLRLQSAPPYPGTISWISARAGRGLAALPHYVASLLSEKTSGHSGDAWITPRLRQHLSEALHELREAARSPAAWKQPELLSPLLSLARHHLQAVTSASRSPEMLERIFSRFCIGK